MSGYEDIAYEIDGPIARIVLNRPERLNALRIPQTMDELSAVLAEIDGNRELRVVIITGSGEKAFSTGFDLKEPGAWPPDDTGWYEMANANFRALLKIWELRQPVIAAVNGLAIAAGANLAMICDLTLAADHATFGEPEVRHLALSPLLLLPWLTTSKAVHELYYTGDTISAQRAAELGIVNRVVPAAELQDEALRLAHRIALVPPLAVELTKQTIKKSYEMMGFRNALDWHRMADTFLLAASTPEKEELRRRFEQGGLRAFLAARDGQFRDE
jgi:enoyl-CoA hydratase/carnithine racemase